VNIIGKNLYVKNVKVLKFANIIVLNKDVQIVWVFQYAFINKEKIDVSNAKGVVSVSIIGLKRDVLNVKVVKFANITKERNIV
jgi:hypothetical protein